MEASVVVYPMSVCSSGLKSPAVVSTSSSCLGCPSTANAVSCSFWGSALSRNLVARPACQEHSRFVSVRPVRAAKDAASKISQAFGHYAVPIDAQSTFITRPLAEILRDMNKRVPDKVLKFRVDEDGHELKYIPWYHANRMLSFYAPGWRGEVRNVSFSPDGKSVSVVYRITICGTDGEILRDSTGTASMEDTKYGDPVQKAEGMAFRRACARFGLGLYLYHEDEVPAS